MPSYSQSSKDKLSTCHPDLQIIFNEVIKYFDNIITCGHRGEKEQEEAFNNGYSKAHFGQSKHNSSPSMAVDSIPYPVDYKDINRMRFYAGFVLGIAQILLNENKISHKLVSGFDWNSDTELKDTKFQDAPHFELKK
jgi:peptidoglycan L-alanyl-D-glutamate endopeptidase CwlK